MDKLEKIDEILIALGITPNLNGFHAICTALEVMEEISQEKTPVSSELYRLVADKIGSTSGGVESSIRHAFQRMDTSSEIYNKYIGINPPSNIPCLNMLYYRQDLRRI